MVQYMYDAWGNHKIVDGYGNTITSSTHIGIINPIRYRSYYYDTETGLYYLQARYYDPVIGRFISPDDVDYIDPEVINGLNLYAYCGNNPVMNVDPSGHSFTAFLIGFLIFGAFAFGATVYADYKDDGQIFNGSIAWYEYLGITLLAGTFGGLLGLGFSAFGGMSFSFGIPTFGLTTTGGALAIGVTGTITVTITGAQILTGIAVLGGIGGLYLFAKKSKLSGKERSTDKPSWVNKSMVDYKKSALQNAIDMLNSKYGYGNWHEGANTEFNKIMKWLVRGLGLK